MKATTNQSSQPLVVGTPTARIVDQHLTDPNPMQRLEAKAKLLLINRDPQTLLSDFEQEILQLGILLQVQQSLGNKAACYDLKDQIVDLKLTLCFLRDELRL